MGHRHTACCDMNYELLCCCHRGVVQWQEHCKRMPCRRSLLLILCWSSITSKITSFVLNGHQCATTKCARDGGQRQRTTTTTSLAFSSINPNDLETPEERHQRMELVKKLQKSFYKDEAGITVHECTIENLSLWRVQWTELPGFQNVLNCHVAHYTHMFMKILSLEKPWYFGHLYLPGGSENLENPLYRLDGEMATLTGVLMRVADYKQLEDGRLLLIVQALERFRVVEATQHSPYAVATVELLPDEELMEIHSSNKDEEVDGRAAAVAESRRWESFEFRNVAVEDAGGGVSPLANFDASALLDMNGSTATTHSSDSVGAKQVLELEHDVWVSLDLMIRLLTAVNPSTNTQVPIPTQLLGLFPTNNKWPKGFRLDSFATQLQRQEMVVGTMSKSPFCLVDRAAPSYPPLRRAHRLSYAIWVLLDSIIAGGGAPQTTRQDILEMSSTKTRLLEAKTRIDAINMALQQALEQS